MRKLTTIILAFFAFSLCAQQRTFIGAEFDPAPFMLRGYSVSLKMGLPAAFTVMTSVFRSDFPDGMMSKTNRDNGFEQMKINTSFAFFIEYYTKKRHQGFGFGPAIFWYNRSVGQTAANRRAAFSTLYPNFKVGYVWYPFKKFGFYLHPWVNVGSEFNLDKNNQIGEMVYQPSRFYYIAAIHLGYSITF